MTIKIYCKNNHWRIQRGDLASPKYRFPLICGVGKSKTISSLAHHPRQFSSPLKTKKYGCTPYWSPSYWSFKLNASYLEFILKLWHQNCRKIFKTFFIKLKITSFAPKNPVHSKKYLNWLFCGNFKSLCAIFFFAIMCIKNYVKLFFPNSHQKCSKN